VKDGEACKFWDEDFKEFLVRLISRNGNVAANVEDVPRTDFADFAILCNRADIHCNASRRKSVGDSSSRHNPADDLRTSMHRFARQPQDVSY
jgi:hypothetical protein